MKKTGHCLQGLNSPPETGGVPPKAARGSVKSQFYFGGGGAVLQGVGFHFEPFGSSLNCVLV